MRSNNIEKNRIMDSIVKIGESHSDRRMERAVKKFKTPSYYQTHTVLTERKDDGKI